MFLIFSGSQLISRACEKVVQNIILFICEIKILFESMKNRKSRTSIRYRKSRKSERYAGHRDAANEGKVFQVAPLLNAFFSLKCK
jgi:hypothetical protein